MPSFCVSRLRCDPIFRMICLPFLVKNEAVRSYHYVFFLKTDRKIKLSNILSYSVMVGKVTMCEVKSAHSIMLLKIKIKPDILIF